MTNIADSLVKAKVLRNDSHPVIRYSTQKLLLYKADRQGLDIMDEEFRNHIKGVGVYFYVGPGPSLYIGESFHADDRRKEHIQRGDWDGWDELLFVHDDDITSGVRKRLERECIERAKKCSHIKMINSKGGVNEPLSEEEGLNLRRIMSLLPHLMYVAGYDFLLDRTEKTEEAPAPVMADGRPVFLIKGDSGVLGTGTVVDGEFWVCRGTRLKPRTKHFQKGDRAIYDALVSDGTIVGDEFARDWKADSHVVAARMVLGTTGGDMKYKWRTSDSVMVDAYLRSEAEKKDE